MVPKIGDIWVRDDDYVLMRVVSLGVGARHVQCWNGTRLVSVDYQAFTKGFRFVRHRLATPKPGARVARHPCQPWHAWGRPGYPPAAIPLSTNDSTSGKRRP